MSSLYANPTSGTDMGSFMNFLNRQKKKPGSPLTPQNGTAIGSSTNSAIYGGNLVSPALRSMLGLS